MKAALVLVALACVPGLGCAGSPAPSASSHSVHSTQTLALRLEGAEVRLRGSLRAWRASDPGLREPPPAAALNVSEPPSCATWTWPESSAGMPVELTMLSS